MHIFQRIWAAGLASRKFHTRDKKVASACLSTYYLGGGLTTLACFILPPNRPKVLGILPVVLFAVSWFRGRLCPLQGPTYLGKGPESLEDGSIACTAAEVSWSTRRRWTSQQILATMFYSQSSQKSNTWHSQPILDCHCLDLFRTHVPSHSLGCA